LLKRHAAARQRADFHAALICSVLYNTAPFLKRTRAFTPADFMPQSNVPARKLTPAEMLEKIKALNIALGGTVI